jgi:hypothetical protein
MNISAVTSPTRGLDYVAPSATRGTPIVTEPQPASPVATETTFTAAALAMESMLDIRRKRMIARADRAPPERYLMATRGTIAPLLQDIPAGYIPAHLAAQAYQAQRRFRRGVAPTSTHAGPAATTSATMSADEPNPDPATPEHPTLAASSQRRDSLTTGGLDVTV